MFEDRDEALARLQRELDAQEAQDALPPEPPVEDEPLIYRNFANNYGRDLRNFASGYQPCTEEAPKEKPLWPLVALAGGLLAANIAVLLRWLILAGGSK